MHALPRIALSAATLAVVLATPADAAFPGSNGPIAFERGGELALLAPGAPSATALAPASSHDPAISPDGGRVAYVANRDIWVRNADGSHPRRITTTAADNADPSWSPDGRRIVLSTRTQSSVDLASVDARGGKPVLLTRTADHDEHHPAWSPDGRQIAYERTGCEPAGGVGKCVFVMAPDGTAQTDLTPETSLPGCESQPGYRFSGSSSSPSWSPDSSRIVFTGPVLCSVSALGSDLWTMSRTGAGKVNLTADDATNDVAPSFSPDGKAIVFQRGGPAGGGLAVIGAAGGAVVPITADARDRQPDWGAMPTSSCVVPRLARRSLVAARTALRRAGCRLGAVRRRRTSGRQPAATVLTQSLSAGRDELAGTRVAVLVGARRR